jgi:alkylation response protein AidB-like acyl-CoA dehydrogenase
MSVIKSIDDPNFLDVLASIRSRADRIDQTGEWPQEDLNELSAIGAMRWAVPPDLGGDELSPLELHLRYEAIASASLTTALVVSQRDSAVGILAGAQPSPRVVELLRKLARNGLFTTIGIAQLTTSRQRGAPALRATPVDGGAFKLDGEIPWATGAEHCDFIMAGAALEDRRQIIFALPTNLPGVRVQPPMPLVALRGSHTTSVLCDGTILDAAQIVSGPSQQALASRRNSIPIGQVFLATGLCRAGLDLIQQIDSEAARSAYAKLDTQLTRLRDDVLAYCDSSTAPDATRGASLRGRSIELAQRITRAAVSVHKGTALLAGHPAQRLAREALFLLVLSCPGPVVECTLELLSQGHRDEG